MVWRVDALVLSRPAGRVRQGQGRARTATTPVELPPASSAVLWVGFIALRRGFGAVFSRYLDGDPTTTRKIRNQCGKLKQAKPKHKD